MKRRIARILGTLGIVIVAYWCYALVVVPFIEPSLERRANVLSANERAAAENAYRNQQQNLGFWFKEGDWELSSPKVLETPRAKLLLQTYKRLDNGLIEITPCTMIFQPEGEFADEDERKRRAIVLRAPEGAVLRFDGGFDLLRRKPIKLLGGHLNGAITITSDQRLPGADDDLVVVTRDMELSETRITTPHEVDFRLGPNQGSGRRLAIDIAPAESASPMSKSVANLRAIELGEAVRLLLQPTGGDAFPGGADHAPAQTSNSPPAAPIAITCRGPFRFEIDTLLATFVDDVRVERQNAQAPADWLTCRQLNLLFENATPPAAEGQAAGRGSLKLQARKLDAVGAPVVVVAPTNEVRAEGEHLSYDIVTRAGSLTGASEVFIIQAGREIHARELHFQPDMLGWLGQFEARGTGWFRGAAPDDAARMLDARWNESLLFRPHEGLHVLSVTGAAHVSGGDRGSIDGQAIHMWFSEVASAKPAPPGEPPKKELQPEKLLATGDVRIDAPQLAGNTPRLEACFENVRLGSAEPAAQAPNVSPVAASPLPPLAAVAPAAAPVAGSFVAVPAYANISPAQAPSSGRFHVAGDLLQVYVSGGPAGMHLREAVVDGHVRLTEMTQAGDMTPPFHAHGNRVHVVQRTEEDAHAVISGAPAVVEARGLVLQGAAIEVDRAANRLSSDGAGVMVYPVDRDLAGQSLAEPQNLTVNWQGRMTFDGLTAVFSRQVVAVMAPRQIHTEQMEVTLLRPIHFGEAGGGQTSEVDRVTCRGGVFMDSRAFEGQSLVSVDRMWSQDLTVHAPTGDMVAGGPGRASSIRVNDGRGEANLFAGQGQPAAGDGAPKSPFNYLEVRFNRGIQGNLRRKELDFHEEVRAIYGGVANWNATLDMDRYDTLGANDFVINTDLMRVRELPSLAGSAGGYELEALGNTTVESQIYEATAARLSYEQAKSLLVLEGGPYADAKLYRQQHYGGQRDETSARKILYSLATNSVKIEGGQAFDFRDQQRR